MENGEFALCGFYVKLLPYYAELRLGVQGFIGLDSLETICFMERSI